MAAPLGLPSAITVEQIWQWLGEVADPEIPVISIVDLGIVRNVGLLDDTRCVVTMTATYSGCPALQVITEAVTAALHGHGLSEVQLVNQLSPAWTTDWMSEHGKKQLTAYGIAPPAQRVMDMSGLQTGLHTGLEAGAKRQLRHALPKLVVNCPNCGSSHTEVSSQFGSTPCKALYKCLDCREPFDYFKCH